MNLYVLLGILAVFGFIAWRLYRAGAKNKAISIERDSLEENLGVEHAIRDELTKEKKGQKEELDRISNDFDSARNVWLRDNPSSPSPRDP